MNQTISKEEAIELHGVVSNIVEVLENSDSHIDDIGQFTNDIYNALGITQRLVNEEQPKSLDRVRSYRDLPNQIETKDGVIFTKGYIHEAQTDAMVEANQHFSSKALSDLLALTAMKCGKQFTIEFLKKALALYEAKERFEG